MKKVFNVLVVCSALLSVFSCTNPDIEISKVVTVEVDPSSVIAAFKPYDQSDFDFYTFSGKKTKLHIKALLYNEEGGLLNEYDGDLDSFSNKLQILMAVSGNCKLLCFSYLALGKDFETHTIRGKEKLSTLNIEQNNLLGFAPLGYSSVTLSVTNSKVSVNLESLSSLIYLQYANVHAKDALGVDEYKMWLHLNDIAKYNGTSFSYDTSLAVDRYYIDDLNPADFPGNYVYSYWTCLPGTFDTFASMSIGSDRTDTEYLKMSVQSGHQYVLDLNCASMSLSTYEGPLGTKTNSECEFCKKQVF